MSHLIKATSSGASSASVAGVKYEADADGVFTLPLHHFIELQSHGFTAVDGAILEEDHTMLLGSSVQPSTFLLTTGGQVQLGTVVAKAQIDSGFTPTEWNDLADVDREELIAAEVAKLPVIGADPDPEITQGDDGAGDGDKA